MRIFLMILKDSRRTPSFCLLDSYYSLYLNNLVESSISIGVFLREIGDRYNKSLYQEVAQLHLHFSNSPRNFDYFQLPDAILEARLLRDFNHQENDIYRQIQLELTAIPVWKGNNLLLYSNYITHSNFIF